MKNISKRILALILAMLIATFPLVSSAETTSDASGHTLMSLLPIEEVYAHIDLTEIPLEKLPQMTVSDLFSYLRDNNTNELIDLESADTSVWANFFNENGEYLYDTWEVIKFNESINILEQCLEYNYGIEVIIGSGNQLDTENVRYIINFQLPHNSARVDFSDYMYEELFSLNAYELASNASENKIDDAESVEILWYVKDHLERGFNFDYEDINGWIKFDYDDKMKIAPTLEEMYTCGWWNNSLTMVIKADDNIEMYNIYTYLPEYLDMFEFSIYTQDNAGKRSEVKTSGTYGYESKRTINDKSIYYYSMYTEIYSHYSTKDVYYLGMNLNPEFASCDLNVLKGWDYSTDEIKTMIIQGTVPKEIDITDKIVAEDMTQTDAGMKEYWLQSDDLKVMICVKRNNDLYVFPASIGLEQTYSCPEVDGIFTDIDGRRSQVINHVTYDYKEEKIGDLWYYTDIYTYYLKENYAADNEYYLGMIFYNGDTHTTDTSKVDKAVKGIYYSLEDAKKQPDIKKQLFPEDTFEVGSGYKANFSGEGVEFTIFANDHIYHYIIKTAESNFEEPPASDDDDEYVEPPQIGSYDNYFRVNDLYNADDRLDTYIVPYKYDTYYSYGYQTLLINDTDVDMSAISPQVILGDQVKVYYGDSMEKTNSDYYNKLAPRDFTKAPFDVAKDPYNSIRYTVSTKDHSNQKNYWVTAVNKEEGAKLFVNGPDEREIFLNNYFENVHDIFIANVGTEELTGITATIDATNIKLDDYWTIGGDGNDTLAPFTTTSSSGSAYGELFNVARIRLIPDGEGEIEGTLTISADGQEPRVITLRGTAGNPKIDTTAVHDAIKYVPYSSIITTNNMHDWNSVKFSIYSGKLPDGLTLYPNGEIYGVPKETGEFSITVRAEYSYSEFDPSYADLVLKVEENSDANINASVDDGYEITTRLPSVISKITDMDFVIDGEFSEFVDLWLDGDKLTENIDYTAVEGSTKITIKSKTISNAGKGKHTISAEFRVGGDKNNELKTASQNFTVGSTSVATSDGGGGITNYAVTFETNGGSPVNKQVVKSGNKLLLLPTPEKEGYIFAGWFMDKNLTHPFNISEVIRSNLKLYAKWETVSSEKAPVELPIFADVTTSDWFYDDVNWAFTNNIMIGYNNEQFAPSETITSAMVVTVLARLANANISDYENKQFEDVSKSQWYTPYANWAKDVGIADDISFIEPAEISREMMGVVLFRFLKYMGKAPNETAEFVEFADKDLISSNAMEAIQTLYKLEILKGKANNTIDPTGNTIRAEFAALIHRVYTFINK